MALTWKPRPISAFKPGSYPAGSKKSLNTIATPVCREASAPRRSPSFKSAAPRAVSCERFWKNSSADLRPRTARSPPRAANSALTAAGSNPGAAGSGSGKIWTVTRSNPHKAT